MLEWLQSLDESALWWIAEHLRAPALTALLSFYTHLGDGGRVFILAAALMLFFRLTRRSGAAALLSMLFGLLVTNLTLKPLVGRLRPWIVMEGFAALVEEGDMNSFPSGHSCAAFAFATALCMTLPDRRAKAAALTAAALMALSRLYLGVHFPSDVLAGVLIGALCGLLGAWMVIKITERWEHRPAPK